ncbi:glycosyltransferase family 9 protein [Mucilaginibacter sp. KACC 22063]|uniref:glycosyltransferase family 9 protein n=1 Tax=Mucilaginibacter sp. KACC 22063 TaxID=3025666 RepID=UPI0023672022|nr:glycosyltransferase family 9 protein [Mucilaginibacter sp. KACC 22063]WDF54607.1 glycosyltransferase family 9 protein [Mucilaginibacter sp. KACC 22063]
MSNWSDCKRILVIRPDNMGDLIMSGPAIKALKQSFNAHITVLTSSMAKGIIKHMPMIDDAIIFDLPWVKTNQQAPKEQIYEVVERLKKGSFDAAVIFTVFSQNPLPTAMLAYMAGIPKILAYCRENPYGLLTDWIPDKEPYNIIKHQVQRDLDLVASVGAYINDDKLDLLIKDCGQSMQEKLMITGINLDQPWLLLHAGVSEPKREYPFNNWVIAAKKIITQLGYQVLLTGAASEKVLTDKLQQRIGEPSFSVAGLFDLSEFIYLVKQAPCLVSVNTGTIHIAAAVNTPVVVLYAETNPQHTPWKVVNKVLPFSVPEEMRSKNEVIAYLNKTIYAHPAGMPAPAQIVCAITEIMNAPYSPSQPFHGTLNENQAFPAS